MTENIEKIKSNWETYEKLLGRLADHNINKMIEVLGERILMCPESRISDQPGAYPGGLVEHALSVASTMRKLNDSLKMDVSISSIIKASLLHEIGKIGDEENDLFLIQDSDWHRNNLNQNYKYNDDISKMSISHRTLYLLQKFSINLTREEWVAIQISSGSHFEENRFYAGSETTLGILLQKSKALAYHMSMT